MNKQAQRQRRAKRSRCHARKLNVARLSVYRSLNHIYAQLIAADTTVIAVASTLEKAVRAQLQSELKSEYGGNKSAAAVVGKFIAERALKAGVKQVAFDRSGYKYHGRVMALANSARENGLEF